MARYLDEDLNGTEFRECLMDDTRFIGVVMQRAVIDGLVTDLVVNGVEVMPFVEAALDRRHPVRPLIRSDDADDLREAHRQLVAAWATTVDRMRATPGIERRSANDEWSAVQTLRHLVFVHDSWFRRCVLGVTEPFTPMGLAISFVPDQEESGLDLAADPTLDEVLAVRAAQTTELEGWLADVTTADLGGRAPIPDDGRWPPYASGRSVVQCLRTVLSEEFEHHGFCVRDLALLEADAAG